MSDLIYRLRKRAEIRRQIQTRKSVQEGKPDRIADLLDEAAAALEQHERDRAAAAGGAEETKSKLAAAEADLEKTRADGKSLLVQWNQLVVDHNAMEERAENAERERDAARRSLLELFDWVASSLHPKIWDTEVGSRLDEVLRSIDSSRTKEQTHEQD